MQMFPLVSFAYKAKIGDIYYELFNYTASQFAVVTYNDDNAELNKYAYKGHLVIPSSVLWDGTTYSVTTIDRFAFNGCSDLISITIPESVTNIGIAFSGCSGLTNINIPSGVTNIEYDTFSDCTSLTSVTINSNSIISKERGGIWGPSLKRVFGEQVQEYIIGDKVTSIGDHAFSGCSGLTSITIPNSVTSIGDYAFWDCI